MKDVVLHANSVIACEHRGILRTAGSPAGTTNGQRVLTDRDVLSGLIIGCKQTSLGQVPCTKVVQIYKGLSAHITIDGMPALLQEFKAYTNGWPTNRARVTQVGQSAFLESLRCSSNSTNCDQQRSSSLPQDGHWIELELHTQDTEEPVPDEEYCVTLPDGTQKRGRLDDRGLARVSGIADSGICSVTFPKLDKELWWHDADSR